MNTDAMSGSVPTLNTLVKLVETPALLGETGATLSPLRRTGGAGREGTWSRARVAAPSRILSDCMYMLWERTVMGISVHTAETETAKTPY